MVIHPRKAKKADCALLGELNHQLIQDEGHRNRSTVLQLQKRMRGWLAGEYTAILFEHESKVVAYALYREKSDLIYLRQLFVQRHCRRRGLGQQAFALLRTQCWAGHKRLTVEVLAANTVAIAFWKSVGFQDYCLTLEIMPVAS